MSIRWENLQGGDKKRLTIFKQRDTGFDVVVECETYGLYPFAGDWHGPAWEPMNERLDELCDEFMGFVRTLLCMDSKLQVMKAGGKPYKWSLTYRTEDGVETQTTGLFLFNYFGPRSKQVLQNDHLPLRYAAQPI